MNGESAPQERPRPQHLSSLEGSSDRGRAAPALVVVLPLEGKAELLIRADSLEDERRLRGWLRIALGRRSSLSSEIVWYLDNLDEREAA